MVVDRNVAGGQGFAVAILRAGVGARTLAKSLEVSEFLNLFDVAAPSLFLTTALTPFFEGRSWPYGERIF